MKLELDLGLGARKLHELEAESDCASGARKLHELEAESDCASGPAPSAKKIGEILKFKIYIFKVLTVPKCFYWFVECWKIALKKLENV